LSKNDGHLGMDANITRRDFLDGVMQIIGVTAVASVGGAAALPTAAHAAATMPAAITNSDYPPMRQGLRGFDDAAMQAGHALRDGTRFHRGTDTGEAYDLVVVGSGMAGLSAAYFYRKQIPGAKILVLDGCDDFGGHARRVEFDVDGRQLLVCGGTEEIWNPNTFSPESARLLEDIGIDRDRYYAHAKSDPDPLADRGLKVGVFYDAETFGVDRLVAGRPPLRGTTAEQWRRYFDQTPMSTGLKEGFVKLYTGTTDYMAGVTVEEKVRRLRKMSYADYLRNVAQIHPDTVAYLVRNGAGDTDNQSAGLETFSAWSAWRRGLRGFAGLGLPPPGPASNLTSDPGGNIAFPDGNAGVARLLIRWMIPDALPGSTAEDSIPGRLDYDRLDRSSNDVRIRLSSTVVRVAHLGDPVSASAVEVTYVRDGRPYRVRANAAVMACFNAIIPHIVPELPETQKAALRMAVRKPLVRSFVAIRNWTAFERLGISEVLCPGMFHQYVAPWNRPEWGGAYTNARNPGEPVVLYMRLANSVLELHGSGLPPRDQLRDDGAQHPLAARPGAGAGRLRCATRHRRHHGLPLEPRVRGRLERSVRPGLVAPYRRAVGGRPPALRPHRHLQLRRRGDVADERRVRTESPCGHGNRQRRRPARVRLPLVRTRHRRRAWRRGSAPGRTLGEAAPQPRRRKVDERPQFGREHPLARIDQVQRQRRGLEFPEHDRERAGLDGVGDLVGQHACQADAGDRRVDGGLGRIDDEA